MCNYLIRLNHKLGLQQRVISSQLLEALWLHVIYQVRGVKATIYLLAVIWECECVLIHRDLNLFV